jgi:hypothetical protein
MVRTGRRLLVLLAVVLMMQERAESLEFQPSL